GVDGEGRLGGAQAPGHGDESGAVLPVGAAGGRVRPVVPVRAAVLCGAVQDALADPVVSTFNDLGPALRAEELGRTERTVGRGVGAQGLRWAGDVRRRGTDREHTGRGSGREYR